MNRMPFAKPIEFLVSFPPAFNGLWFWLLAPVKGPELSVLGWQGRLERQFPEPFSARLLRRLGLSRVLELSFPGLLSAGPARALWWQQCHSLTTVPLHCLWQQQFQPYLSPLLGAWRASSLPRAAPSCSRAGVMMGLCLLGHLHLFEASLSSFSPFPWPAKKKKQLEINPKMGKRWCPFLGIL